MRNAWVRPANQLIGAFILFTCSSCTSISTVDSPYQKHLLRGTIQAVVRSRSTARAAADGSSTYGALIFVDPLTKQLKYSLPGDSPTDAWLRYAATSKATQVDDLPLPSIVTPIAVFIPKAARAGAAQIIYTAEFDAVIKERYDLSSAILRLSAAVQQLRDITILLSISDKKQNADISKVQHDFHLLGQNVGQLTSKLEQLSNNENDANRALGNQLRNLSNQLDDLQDQISKIK